MNKAFIALGILILTAYLLLNFYVGLRTYHGLKAFFPSFPRMVFWPVFLVIAFSFILGRVTAVDLSFLNVLGMYFIAVFLYLLLFYLLIDLTSLLNSHFKLLPEALRPFWQSRKIYLLGMVLTVMIILLGSWNAQNLRFSSYDVYINKEVQDVKNLKAVLIADLHLDRYANKDYLEKAAHTITSLEPDIIFLAGDIFENYLDMQVIEKIDRVFEALDAPYGVYAVLGNHEYYGGQDAQIKEYLSQRGIKVLVDEVIDSVDGNLYIAGRNDYGSSRMTGVKRKPLTDILENIDEAKPLILLDHQPQDVKEASAAGVDLMLSGHTHGAQLFPLQIFTKALYIIDRGHWQEGDFNLIVTTGLGTWGPPIKTSSKSEIVIINITFTDQPKKAE